VLISSGYPQRHLLAIKPDGQGNVTQTHVAWRTKDGAVYVPSLTSVDDYVLTTSTAGATYCFEAATGKVLWKEELGKQYPSPVVANGLVYIPNDEGVINVIKPGPTFVRVAQNDIAEKTNASPAISDGQIFLRGDKHLFCIGTRTNGPATSVASQPTLFVVVEQTEQLMTRPWMPDVQPASDPNLPTLFAVGDSTVRTGSKGDGANGQWGWGAPIADFFDRTRINVENRAWGGTSSRTFRTLGFWDKVLADLKPGDCVIMQFGHNDSSPVNDRRRARGTIKNAGDETEEIDNLLTGKHEVVHSYGWYLRQFIRDARAKGATSIVCSPIPRNRWQDGNVGRSSGDYGQWAAEAARAEGAYFIDLNEIIADRYEAMGEEEVTALYFGPGERTHTNAAGALRNATCVVEGLKMLAECPLTAYLKESK
jgi:rhamnogalacturonan acetylesterase